MLWKEDSKTGIWECTVHKGLLTLRIVPVLDPAGGKDKLVVRVNGVQGRIRYSGLTEAQTGAIAGAVGLLQRTLKELT